MTAPNAESKPQLSALGLFVILGATAVALLATPLASPAMPAIAQAFAGNIQSEPFARGLLQIIIRILPGEPSVIFLVKFILLSIPALFIILCAPVVGRVCDRWGRKSLLNASLIVFGISGVSGYFADTFWFLFLGRAVLGLSIAGVKTATVAMVGDYYEGAARNRIIGWQGSAMKLGGVIFMLLGGFLASFSWRTPFLGYLLSFMLVPSALFALSESLPAVTRPRQGQPQQNLPDIPFWPAAFVFISAFMASGLFFVTPVQLPFFLHNAFQATAMQIGGAIALGNTVGALISLSYHKFRAIMSFPAIYAFIFFSMAVGYYILTLASNYWTSLAGMVVAGMGFGLYVPNHSSWILTIVSPHRRGYAVGLVTTAMFLGQFSTAIALQPFIDSNHPAAVWRSLSLILVVLGVIYMFLARFGSKTVSNQV
jgi:MFS family permease